MAECFVHGNVGRKNYLPTLSGTATYQLIDDGNKEWHILVTGSGTLSFTSLGNAENGTSVMLVAGGSAGALNGGYGGGGNCGYYGFTPLANETYNVVIGAGATSSGAVGGITSAFGNSVNPGTAGSVESYSEAVVFRNWSNLYYYKKLSSSAVNWTNARRTVNYVYPAVYGTTSDNNWVRLLYGVNNGYSGGYLLANVESEQVKYSAKNGSGSEEVLAFGKPGFPTVGGTIGTTLSDAVNYGQGGGGAGSPNTYGKGKQGIVIIKSVANS